MKILIASTYIGSGKAGAEKVAWDMAKILAESNEVHVLTLSKDVEQTDTIKIHVVPKLPKPTIFYSTVGYVLINKLLSKYTFDVIHCHMSLPWGYVFRMSKSRKIITLHGCEYLTESRLYRIVAKKAFKKSDCIVSPSNWLRDYVRKNYGYDSVVIRNGIDTRKYNIMKNIQNEENVVLFVGRLIKIKGVIELLRVAKELKNYEFWFAGEGPLKKLISLPNTKYLGNLKEDELISIYNKATICVFPSYKENFPVVGLEALACGKATIATKIGFSEIIDHKKNGLLINPRDQKELTSSIQKLMEDQQMRQIIERDARKKALNFDWHNIVKEYYGVYKK